MIVTFSSVARVALLFGGDAKKVSVSGDWCWSFLCVFFFNTGIALFLIYFCRMAATTAVTAATLANGT